MKKTKRILFSAVMIAAMALPGVTSAAEAAVNSVSVKTELQTEGGFAALQVGSRVFVHDDKSQLFQTNGEWHDGALVDLFVLPYGPTRVPFIVVDNPQGGYLVFSDLWPEFAKGKETDPIQEYFSGRVFKEAQSEIRSKTGHHYATQTGENVQVFTANDFSDISKGFHPSIEVNGKLRGLILFDCCPYVVIENEEGNLDVYHAGETGPEIAGNIQL